MMLLRTSREAYESNTYLKRIYIYIMHHMWHSSDDTVSGKYQLTKLIIGFRATAAAAALSQAPDKMITYFRDRLCRNCETICKSVSTFTLLCVRSSVVIYAYHLFWIKPLTIYIWFTVVMCSTVVFDVSYKQWQCGFVHNDQSLLVWNTLYIYKPHS